MRDEKHRFLEFFFTGLLFFSFPFLNFSCCGLLKSLAGPETVTAKFENLEYSLLKYPVNQKKSRKMPLVLLLHGAQQEAENMLALWSSEAEARRVMIVAPHWSKAFETQSDAEENLQILNLLKYVCSQYDIDETRIYIAGISAGGDKARRLLGVTSRQWRGVIWMSYVPAESWIQQVKPGRLPSLLFTFGGKDRLNHYESLVNAAADLKSRKISVKLLVDPEAGHEYLPEWNGPVFDWIEETGEKGRTILE